MIKDKEMEQKLNRFQYQLQNMKALDKHNFFFHSTTTKNQPGDVNDKKVGIYKYGFYELF